MEGHVQLHEKLDDQLRQLLDAVSETNALVRQTTEQFQATSQRRDGEMAGISAQLQHLDTCVDELRQEIKEVHHPPAPPANNSKSRPIVPVGIGGAVATTISAALYAVGRAFGWWP